MCCYAVQGNSIDTEVAGSLRLLQAGIQEVEKGLLRLLPHEGEEQRMPPTGAAQVSASQRPVAFSRHGALLPVGGVSSDAGAAQGSLS